LRITDFPQCCGRNYRADCDPQSRTKLVSHFVQEQTIFKNLMDVRGDLEQTAILSMEKHRQDGRAGGKGEFCRERSPWALFGFGLVPLGLGRVLPHEFICEGLERSRPTERCG
jgi:hypothetical protein